jgi:outer membrane protein assembly factor BamB
LFLCQVNEGLATCNPFTLVWNSTTGWYDNEIAFGPDSSSDGFGVLLFSQGAEDKLTRIALPSGTQEWYIPQSELDKRTQIYTTTYNNIAYYTQASPKPVNEIARVDGVTGQFLSPLTLEVDTLHTDDLVFPIVGCGNTLYSIVGYVYYHLYANDITTGKKIWSSPDDDVQEWFKITSDCKNIYYISDPGDNTLPYHLVKLDATTGKSVWDVKTKLIRGNYWNKQLFVTLSEPANRVSITFGDDLSYLESCILLFSMQTGEQTFEMDLKKTVPYYVPVSPYFSPNGKYVTFAPRELFLIDISDSGDKQSWFFNSTFGLPELPVYYSPSGQTLLAGAWNFGSYVYTALDTTSGKVLWETEVLPLGYGVDNWFTSPKGDIYAYGGPMIQKADFTKCPLP